MLGTWKPLAKVMRRQTMSLEMDWSFESHFINTFALLLLRLCSFASCSFASFFLCFRELRWTFSCDGLANFKLQTRQWWFFSLTCCYKETHARTNRKSTVKSDGRLLEIHTASTTTTAHTCTCTRHYSATCRHGHPYLHVPLG